MSIEVDDRALRRRLRRLGSAADRVLRRSRREAARQVRTQAKRELAKTLRLPVKRIAEAISVEQASRHAAVRIGYRKAPAHHFKGWRFGQADGGDVRQETATGKVSQRRRTRRSHVGLRIRFQAGAAPLSFPIAFRASRVGQGRVFLQRVGDSAYPLEPILGPPVHSKAIEQLPDYTEHGRAALQRRLAYWVETQANSV